MEPVVRLQRTGDIARIILDSPANRNALSKQLLSEFHDALTAASGSRVIVLDHTGTVFSSGADLRERAAGTPDSTDLVRAMERITTIDAPVIAAVRGAVRAGGMGVVACCDLVVAHSQASFATPEVRVGVAPAIISLPLIERCGWANLAEAMLTGLPFDAARAARIGLVSAVDDEVDARLDQLCTALLAGAPGAMAVTKQLLRGPRRTMAELTSLSDLLFTTDEAVEGMHAFRDKRPPDWTT